MVEPGGRATLQDDNPNPSAARGATRRCRFARRAGLWTLLGDCTASQTVALPRGFALDGNGGTISLAGDAEAFASAGVRVSGAGVRNLTVDGRGLENACPGYLAALVVGGPADVENVTVANVRFGEDCDHAVGIEVAVFDGDAVELRNVTVANIGGTALLLVGDGSITVAESAVRDATRDVQTTQLASVARAGPRPATAPPVAPASHGERPPEPPREGAPILYHPCDEIQIGRQAATLIHLATRQGHRS